jgi:hypothetical protein
MADTEDSDVSLTELDSRVRGMESALMSYMAKADFQAEQLQRLAEWVNQKDQEKLAKLAKVE